jgi:hypothetical protein
MKAVAQQAPGANLAAGFFRDLAQGVQKQPPVFSVEEARLATVAAVQQMINRSRILHSQLARHAPSETKSCNMSTASNDPFMAPRFHFSNTAQGPIIRLDAMAFGNSGPGIL